MAGPAGRTRRVVHHHHESNEATELADRATYVEGRVSGESLDGYLRKAGITPEEAATEHPEKRADNSYYVQ